MQLNEERLLLTHGVRVKSIMTGKPWQGETVEPAPITLSGNRGVMKASIWLTLSFHSAQNSSLGNRAARIHGSSSLLS